MKNRFGKKISRYSKKNFYGDGGSFCDCRRKYLSFDYAYR